MSPPFSFTGVDYIGPLFLRNGDKIWICLFTCCVVRAVHLELVPDLTAEVFILCLRRFTDRRGIPCKIVSDNSKTFRSASKMVTSLLLGMPEMQQHFKNLHMQCMFILEKAPWWGGFYERMVQLVKRCLLKVIGQARLSHELFTVLVEVEATLNSHPISYVSSEDVDEPLTPSHLLVGRRLLNLPDSVNSETDPDFGTNPDQTGLTQRMVYLNRILHHFWERWKAEYLTRLRESHSNLQARPTNDAIAVGDVVLIHEPNKPRSLWRMGRVEELLHGSDGNVRGIPTRAIR